jgi:3D (Asp-Asp-Asp) domain-containing protein/LysM repeat protein
MVSKQKIWLAVALLALVIAIVLSLKRSKNTQDPSGEIKHFSPTTLQKNLRLKNGQNIEEYIEEHIRVGNRAKILSRKQTPAPTRTPAPESATASSSSSKPASTPAIHPAEAIIQAEITNPKYESGKELVHTVTWGDSFATLSEMYKTTPYKIRKLNHLSEEAMLTIDQKLRIIPEQPSTYRVRPGDNLTVIARRFGIERRAIEEANGLDAQKPIWVGQKLILPTEQEKIDTILAEIARKKHEEAQRKKRYQRELLARIKEQKRQRKIAEAKALAEKKAKERQARERRRKEKQARIERAKRVFKETGSKKFKHKMRVIATAYTSHRSQTDRTPFLAAWNNRIRPGMKIIAVSPDLIRRYGITNGVRVKIGGLPGTYVVRDKMNPRLHNHIDIYMGTNRRRALRWGRRRVVLYW